jgi:hypothetical protein
MNSDSIHLERRAAQRFGFHLPVALHLTGTDREGSGFTQDLSARGAFLYTDFAVTVGDAIELTLVMPSEVTLAENMRVRCRGHVLRVCPAGSGAKCGVAVHLEGYEFLPESQNATDAARSFARVSSISDNAPQPHKLDPPA